MKHLSKYFIIAAFSCMALGMNAEEKQDWGDFKLWIDPGHSKKENQGMYGYTEAQKVLRVGLATREYLKEFTTATNANIQMTRDDDQDYVSLEERSDMANASNAVVAMNGDFYAFRDLGITAYQRKLYRNNPAQVDSCFFTASGDMIFSRAGELMGEGEAERFIEANDVVFAVAFGPVLVDNGELQYCSGYPIGEVNTEYSRSCIAMTDELHYLLMTINHTPDARPRATINELARIIYSKNVWKAYTLDGGQTAEIIMMGGPINHVDFGVERAVSDIIYFATAIPEEVRR